MYPSTSGTSIQAMNVDTFCTWVWRYVALTSHLDVIDTIQSLVAMTLTLVHLLKSGLRLGPSFEQYRNWYMKLRVVRWNIYSGKYYSWKSLVSNTVNSGSVWGKRWRVRPTNIVFLVCGSWVTGDPWSLGGEFYGNTSGKWFSMNTELSNLKPSFNIITNV